MKGMWGTVAKGLLGVVGAAAVALVSYMVEHGELPAWLSRTLNGVVSFLTATGPWAAWELLLPILIIGSVSVRLLLIEAAKIKARDDHISVLTHNLQSVSSRLQDLDKMYFSLKAEYGDLAKSHSDLEQSNKDLMELSSALDRKIKASGQDPRPNELYTTSLNEEQLSVFEFIGGQMDSGKKVTKETVIRELRISLLTAEDILESLCGYGFIKKAGGMFDAEWYSLSAAGRSCYLGFRRKLMLNPPTRQG
ncbi:hypothetical protein N5D52_26000 [Pseudomonas sp. GD03860]|uniref:hypothetical protein n=1 Tax=Pseudomonas sp. GD03860 TaxID=2975389 RepID=UPI00244CFBE0|nr:hypothetical protein [Pseudomonas sp. GD03860]MDH0640381.1 hypothetical protein [Pseudomonas sp. GD03860]